MLACVKFQTNLTHFVELYQFILGSTFYPNTCSVCQSINQCAFNSIISNYNACSSL